MIKEILLTTHGSPEKRFIVLKRNVASISVTAEIVQITSKSKSIPNRDISEKMTNLVMHRETNEALKHLTGFFSIKCTSGEVVFVVQRSNLFLTYKYH